MPAPVKLFDVANGNGVVNSGETVARGTLVWYRDDAAKNKVIDAVCATNGYADVVAEAQRRNTTPPAKQVFFNRVLTDFLRAAVRSVEVNAAATAAGNQAGAAIDAELP
jgi:hypothetical protein